MSEASNGRELRAMFEAIETAPDPEARRAAILAHDRATWDAYEASVTRAQARTEAEAEAMMRDRAAPTPAQVGSAVRRLRARASARRTAPQLSSLVYRLPNWRAARWLVALGNRYLGNTRSCWRLVIRYRDPRPGCRYGWGGSLKQTEARRFAVYIRRARGGR